MKNSKKSFKSAGQSTNEVKKSQKHDANLQKNSTLYFQIGLILCLLGTYALFEMQFEERIISPQYDDAVEIAQIEIPPMVNLEPDLPKQEKPKQEQSQYLADKVNEVDDDFEDVEDDVFTPDNAPDTPEPVDVVDIKTEELPVDIEVPYSVIEKVPVYPGCEKKKTNADKRKCMSEKISRLVSKKFNTDVASEHGISGLQKIQTQFTVDKYGNVTNIKIRAPHPALEKEAQRVINRIPSMQPGEQGNKPVGVLYTLPIKFMARN